MLVRMRRHRCVLAPALLPKHSNGTEEKSDWPALNVRPKLQRRKTCLSLSWNQVMGNLPGSEVDRDRLPRRHAGVQWERNRGKAQLCPHAVEVSS